MGVGLGKRRVCRRSAFALLCALFWIAPARADYWAISGAASISDQNFSSTQLLPARLGAHLSWGVGASWETALGARHLLGVELGALYLRRWIELSAVTSETVPYLIIPAHLRFWPARWFSLFGGVYAAVSAGRVRHEVNGSFSTATFVDAGYAATDAGFSAGLGFNFLLGAGTSLLIELRSLYGLADVDRSSASRTRWRDVLGVVGLRFGR